MKLTIQDVTVTYKKKIAIEKASLSGKSGEIIGFIGADGAGKSSLMHAIAGLIKFQGSVTFDKYEYNSPKKAEKAKDLIGFMPQGIGLVLYKNLTVKEHLDFFADIRNIKKDNKFKEYRNRLLKMAGLSKFPDRLANHLSGGMMQKLSLICTLLHRPKLLILDEPTTGVDPLSRLELWNILNDIREEEGTISLVSTAYMQEAQKMDRVYLFDNAHIIAEGTSEKLLQEVKDYTYEPVKCTNPQCIETGHYTYSLKKLNAPLKEPTLEALFFIESIKSGKIPPPIELGEKENKEPIPEIVMSAKGLTKKFGNFIADDHIDMVLKSGEILGLLGANGAGKTTFIKMLLGLYPIDEGELTLLGKIIKSPEDRRLLKSKIGYVSQKFSLYKDMTVRENLLYFAQIHQIPLLKAIKKISKLSTELGFSDYMDYLPKDLPLGINQRFSLSAAILHEPVVLFLDEPTSGVDAIARSQFWHLLQELKEKWKISILITTHYMSEAEYCDRVVLLKEGKKIADDTPKNLISKYPNARNFEDVFLTLYEENL